jgi:hypothetical protein
MKILLWILLLSILLFFSLGNTIPFIPMPSPVVSKYKSPPDYYSDTIAIQGVFSKTIEPMANAPKLNGSRLSGLSTQTNMRNSVDFTQLKNIEPDISAKLQQRQTGSDSLSAKLQSRIQNPEPVHLRSFQSTSASTNASEYPIREMIDRTTPGSSCSGSQYGCCDDGVTAKNADGTSCPAPVGSSCTGSQYGCCDDGFTAKNADGTSCPAPVGTNCTGSQYGCCDDGVTAKNADGTSCPAPAPVGSNCTGSQYGCCDDGVTAKNADGTSCPAPSPGSSCVGSQYGCCPDGVTAKNANGSSCAPYPPSGPSVYILPIQPPAPQPNPYPPQPTYSPTQPNPYPPQPTYSPTQPNDPYTHSEQPLDTVYLSPPMGKPTVPTCPTPQPCPPCGRCPEPSFECKKVPNYSSTSNVLPVPVLTDFSQFGM